MSGIAFARALGAATQHRKELSDFGANDAMKYSAADAARLMADFDVELVKAISPGSISKGVSPEVTTMLGAGGFGMGVYADTLGQIIKAIQGLNPDLAKDITLTSPLASGFVPFDLMAPSRKVFPALSPLRNRIPRTQGQGTAARFKRVTGISGSGTGGVADIRPFISEFSTTSTWGSSTLVRPPKIVYASDEQTVTYRFQGLSDSVTFGAEWGGRGFESIRALSSFSLMKAMMLNEEKGIIGGRTVALTAPTTFAAGTSRAAQTGETGLSGGTTSVYAKYTAVGQFGETAVSTSVSTTAYTAGNVIDYLVPDIAGALAYKLYTSTGAADPGDASRFYAGTFASNQFTLMGALPTTGDTASAHASDSGTSGANDYDGMFAQLDANGGVAKRLNAAPTATMFDADLASVWDKFKSDPDEILLNGTDRVNLSNAVINVASQNQAYRIALTANDQDSVIAGAMVTSYLNKVTGKAVKLTVHPWFKQGNAVIASWALPFPWSETPNTIEVRNVQDYMQIDWPVIQMSYDLSILLYGALVIYTPIYFNVYHGIAQTYGATTGAKYS